MGERKYRWDDNKVKDYFPDKKYSNSVPRLIKQKSTSCEQVEVLKGIFRTYAYPKLIKEESIAWQNHVLKKHQQ